MLREYDFTVIVRGELPEAEAGKALSQYEGLMVGEGGDVLKKEEWGVKRLAYPIKKSYRGYYVNYDFVGQPSSVAEMERLMRIDDNILRYLVVRINEDHKGDIDIAARRVEMVNQEREAREAEAKRRKE